MSNLSNIFAAIAAGAVLGVVPQASAGASEIGFDVNVTVGDATATGFFSGIVGNSNSDVGAPFELTLTEGLTSATFGSEPGINGEVAVGPPLGNAITVTADHVFFNFSDPDPEFLKFYSSANNGTFLCFQTYAFCGGTGAGIDIEVAGGSDPFQSMTGNQVIASVASVPELSTWAMLLLGFGGLGFAGYYQNRAAQHA
jgi:hypothetical protein